MNRFAHWAGAVGVASLIIFGLAACGPLAGDDGPRATANAGKADHTYSWYGQFYWLDNAGAFQGGTGERAYDRIDFDWGAGSPQGVGVADRFASRFYTFYDVQAGERLRLAYRVGAFDTVRIYVGPVGSLDGAIARPPQVNYTNATGAPTTLPLELSNLVGTQMIVVEHIDQSGAAELAITFGDIEQTLGNDPWTAEYWANVKHLVAPGSEASIDDEVIGALAAGSSPPARGGLMPYRLNHTETTTCPVSDDGACVLDRDWRYGGVPGGTVDHFAGRFQRRFGPGTYRLTVAADDQLYLYLDGQRQSPALLSPLQQSVEWTFRVLPGTTRRVTLVYVEVTETAGFYARVERTGDAGCEPGQWLVERFDNPDLQGQPREVDCVAPTSGSFGFSKEWGDLGPFSGSSQSDWFSLRLTGSFHFTGGNWRLRTHSDDAARLWLRQGTTEIARLAPPAAQGGWNGGYADLRLETPPLRLQSGTYQVTVEYRDNTLGAKLHVGREMIHGCITPGTLCEDDAGTQTIGVVGAGGCGFNYSLSCYHLCGTKPLCPWTHRRAVGQTCCDGGGCHAAGDRDAYPYNQHMCD